jgi:preprotein translocase subunit SecE
VNSEQRLGNSSLLPGHCCLITHKEMFQFFVEVKNELAKVVWPTRSEVIKYTLTVIVFSVVVALILGAFDFLLLKMFEAIVSR